MEDEEKTSAEKFDEAISAIEKPVTDLFTYSRKTRNLLWALIGSLIFDLVVTMFVSYFAIQVHDTSEKAADTAEKTDTLLSTLASTSCESRNEFKKLDLERWLYVLEISSQADATPRDRASSALFRKYIVKADALEDCTQKLIEAEKKAELAPKK